MTREKEPERTLTVCVTTPQAASVRVPPAPASPPSIRALMSGGICSVYRVSHPSTVVRAEVKNSGNSLAKRWPCSTVGGITRASTPAIKPRMPTNMTETAMPRLRPSLRCRQGIARSSRRATGSRT